MCWPRPTTMPKRTAWPPSSPTSSWRLPRIPSSMPGKERLYASAPLHVWHLQETDLSRTHSLCAGWLGNRRKACRQLRVICGARCPDVAGITLSCLHAVRHAPFSRAKVGEVACRYTSSGYENADLCAWTFSSSTFASGGGLANLRWNCPAAAAKAGCTSRYYLIQVMTGTPQLLNPDWTAVQSLAPSATHPGHTPLCSSVLSEHQSWTARHSCHCLCSMSVVGQDDPHIQTCACVHVLGCLLLRSMWPLAAKLDQCIAWNLWAQRTLTQL